MTDVKLLLFTLTLPRLYYELFMKLFACGIRARHVVTMDKEFIYW